MITLHTLSKYFLLFTCFLCTTSAIACTNGDKAFERMQYSKAIKNFEKCLKKNPNDNKIIEKLADTYSILDRTKEAESLYAQIAKTSKTYHPAMLKYAAMLWRNQKKSALDSLILIMANKYPKQKEIINLKNKIEEYNISSNDYHISLAPFNGITSDFCPIYYGKNIVFSSNRTAQKRKDLFTGYEFSQMYSFDTVSKIILPFAPEINSSLNVGAATFDPKSGSIYFTANQKSRSKSNSYFLNIYNASFENNKFSKPTLFTHNKVGFNNAYPALSPNGQLLIFSSDASKSSGMDLYLCVKNKNNKWNPPTKLGNNINTKFNEVFPFFVNDTTLIFSSDGHKILGNDLDLYIVYYKNKNWTNPERLKAPFNSTADDFGLCTNDNLSTGYFTSNRNRDDGIEDIYYFYLPEDKKSDSLFFADISKLIPQNMINFNGYIYSEIGHLPLPGIKMLVQTPTSAYEVTTNENGYFQLDLPQTLQVDYSIQHEGYLLKSGTIMHDENESISEISNNLYLSPLKKDMVFALENIYYDFDKWDLNELATMELDKLYEFLLLNPSVIIELSAHTDARGNDAYNQKLSEKRAKSAADHLVSKGIQKRRIVSKGYGESRHINNCTNGVECSEEDHARNRRTEVKILSL